MTVFVAIFNPLAQVFGPFGRLIKPHGPLEPSARYFAVSSRFGLVLPY